MVDENPFNSYEGITNESINKSENTDVITQHDTDIDELKYNLGLKPRMSSGAGAPTVTPNKIGDFYYDTTNNIAYIAGGSTSSDWKPYSNNGVLLGNIRGNDSGTTPGYSLTSSRFMAVSNALVTSLGVTTYLCTNGAKITMGLYSDDGTHLVPNALLAQTEEYTYTKTEDDNSMQVLDLQTPVPIVKGTIYWIGIMLGNTKPQLYANTGTTRNYAYRRNVAYSATMPDPFGAGGITDWWWNLWAV